MRKLRSKEIKKIRCVGAGNFPISQFPKFLPRGQAVLMTVIFLLFLSVAVLFGLSTVVFSEVRLARSEENSLRSYTIAEAGAEDISYRIIRGKQYVSPATLVLDGSTAVTSVTTAGSAREVVSQGSIFSRFRSVKSVLTTTAGASFVYGAQVGDGGLVMENSSRVSGSVYSNGDIVGFNSPEITGDAFAAASSSIMNIFRVGADARANRIQDTAVVRNATSTTAIAGGSVGAHGYADSFSGGTVSGNAYYVTSVSATTTVQGQRIQLAEPPSNLSKLSLPISDTQLDAWERDASLIGTTTPGTCPYKPANGSTLQGVITCGVEIEGTKVITLTGTLHVQGDFEMENSAELALAPSFCATSPFLSGIVVVDQNTDRSNSGKVSIENSAQILGCGSGSYIMVASRNNSAEVGGNEVAVDLKNSSASAIFYAPHGEMVIQNTIQVKEATAWRLHTKNSAEVRYESGLNNVQFSSGPAGGWRVGSWQEVP